MILARISLNGIEIKSLFAFQFTVPRKLISVCEMIEIVIFLSRWEFRLLEVGCPQRTYLEFGGYGGLIWSSREGSKQKTGRDRKLFLIIEIERIY